MSNDDTMDIDPIPQDPNLMEELPPDLGEIDPDEMPEFEESKKRKAEQDPPPRKLRKSTRKQKVRKLDSSPSPAAPSAPAPAVPTAQAVPTVPAAQAVPAAPATPATPTVPAAQAVPAQKVTKDSVGDASKLSKMIRDKSSRRNTSFDSFSFGPIDISPESSIHQIDSSKVRSDLENDTDNQCHSANCHVRKKRFPPKGKVCCYICGYPCFQRGGTMYDTFSVQCEHVLPVAVLSLLSGLSNGTSREKRFSNAIDEVKKNIGIDKSTITKYDGWRNGIIGSKLVGSLIREGGGVRGSAYQWAHPVCNMIKSNYPFITICYTRYGFFFVSDGMKILLPPGILKSNYTPAQQQEIESQVPGNKGFEEFTGESARENFLNESISSQNLIWLFKTILGAGPVNSKNGTKAWASYSEQWTKAILLKDAKNDKGKGQDWSNISSSGNNKYKQLLEESDGVTGFKSSDPIFSEAFGIQSGDISKLKLSLFDDGVKGDYLPYEEWIEKRIQKIKTNILLPLLQKICSEKRYPYPVYEISTMKNVPEISLFSMISTTATGSRICRNMVQLKKTYFDVSDDKKRATKINIIWASILFEDLLEVCAKVVKSKSNLLGMNFDMNTSQIIRKIAKTTTGLASILKKAVVASGSAFINKAKKMVKTLKGDGTKKTKKTKKTKNTKKKGGGIRKREIGTETDYKQSKRIKIDPPEPTTPRKSQHAPRTLNENKSRMRNFTREGTDLEVKIKTMIFDSDELINAMRDKLLKYLDMEKYPYFLEFILNFINKNSYDDKVGGGNLLYPKDKFNDSIITSALSEYNDGDPCCYSSLPVSLCNTEGLRDSWEHEKNKGHKYREWWVYLEYFIDSETVAAGKKIARSKAATKKKKKKKSRKRKKTRK